jgi:hypothetical protein
MTAYPNHFVCGFQYHHLLYQTRINLAPECCHTCHIEGCLTPPEVKGVGGAVCERQVDQSRGAAANSRHLVTAAVVTAAAAKVMQQ